MRRRLCPEETEQDRRDKVREAVEAWGAAEHAVEAGWVAPMPLVLEANVYVRHVDSQHHMCRVSPATAEHVRSAVRR